ncbi:MAG: hypothetical protein GY847_09925 [Proteobacteria bacterium]|nr:hypothetical protein [Pseudomonadota bacterium]
MSIIKILAALTFCIALPVLAESGGLGQGTAEVQSDKLKVEHNLRRARFEGNVQAVWGGLNLKCDRMEISYDDKGEVISLKAEGRVTVTRDKATATASSARLDTRQSLLILEGKPVLVQGAHRLEGARIAIHLKSGQLDVIEAKGRFKLGKDGNR